MILNPFSRALKAGLSCMQSGDLEGALAEFRPALSKALAANARASACSLARNASLALEKLGDSEGASALLKGTLTLLEEAGLGERPEPRDLLAIGLLAGAANDKSKAIRYLEDSRKRCVEEGDEGALALVAYATETFGNGGANSKNG